jgi:glycosyltransferase involved in cell wall biosynthesis
MVKLRKANYDLVFIISQATVSPQLIQIIKSNQNILVNQFVYVLEDQKTNFLSSIEATEVPLKILPDFKGLSLIRNLIPIGRFLVKNRPKLILTSGQSATLLGMPLGLLFRVRSRIYIRHHADFHHRYGFKWWIQIDKLMNMVATKIVAVSENVREILLEKESVNQSKVIKIYNGVDVQRFQSLPKPSTNESKNFRIGIISKWTDLKGVEFTLRAFKKFNQKYPNSFLHYIGPDYNYVREVTSELGGVPINSYLIEELNLDVPKFLSELDGLIHVPVAPQVEAFGLVYIEGLASGKKCIFTISGVLRELPFPNRYFALVPPKNSDAIFNALEDIYRGNSTFEKIPRDWLDQFSLENQGINYTTLIQNEIGKR